MEPTHVGIGGWNFAPWRGTFYPPGLPQAQELAFASRQVTSIEINATFYGSQKLQSFQKWHDESPDGFVFAVKGPRYATHHRDLAEASKPIERFLQSGVLALREKLGPILWQFPATRRFARDEMRPFLQALPSSRDGQVLRHVIETQHASFVDPAWPALLREFGVAPAIVESDKHAMVADLTAPFIYARLERNSAGDPEGYAAEALDRWADVARCLASGTPVNGLPAAGPKERTPAPRPCFIYFISGDKVRAPDSARAMLRRLAA